MSILLAILIGCAAGVFIGWIFRDSIETRVTYAVLGTAGSLAGLGLYFLTATEALSRLFDMTAIIFEAMGAAIFIGIFKLVSKKAPASF